MTHSSAGLPEVHIAPLLSQVSSMPTAFFSKSSMVLDLSTCWGLHYNHSFTVSFTRWPQDILLAGLQPWHTSLALSGSLELLYRPHDFLNLASVVPVKSLSYGQLCQVLPPTWNGTWPPGQELWWLLYANSGKSFLGNCFWAGNPNSIILSLGSLLSNESESFRWSLLQLRPCPQRPFPVLMLNARFLLHGTSLFNKYRWFVLHQHSLSETWHLNHTHFLPKCQLSHISAQSLLLLTIDVDYTNKHWAATKPEWYSILKLPRSNQLAHYSQLLGAARHPPLQDGAYIWPA